MTDFPDRDDHIVGIDHETTIKMTIEMTTEII